MLIQQLLNGLVTTYGDGDFWHSIRVGREAATWEWGKRLGD